MRALVLAAGLALVTLPAAAKEWTVDYAHSRLGFIGTQGSASFQGEFRKFEAHIDFDPANPGTGKITAAIDMLSATAGSPDRDGTLPQPDWFDTKKFPQAQFASSFIRKAGGNSYVADGTLTIKGVSQPVSLPFTLVKNGDHWVAHGRTRLMRNAFNVGIGEWANENYVGYAVDVVIDIAAKPAP